MPEADSENSDDEEPPLAEAWESAAIKYLRLTAPEMIQTVLAVK